jgi:PAS domain S-box-containing protein
VKWSANDLSGYVRETLREGREFDLYRGRLVNDAGTVLVLSPGRNQETSANIDRLQHEYAFKEGLDPSWALRPLALTQHDGRAALMFTDPGGEPLDQILDGRPLELTRFLRLAVAIAGALRKAHRSGFVHKDIKPANVLVDAAGQVHLTGFGIASRLPSEGKAAPFSGMLSGTLAYMAPEQTGRMNRSLDARTDLYSFGVILYEMLTGALPFSASDPTEWVHCHVAQKPPPPSASVSGLPDAIEGIILKLLAKNADDRYQTAAGAEADLGKCLSAWTTSKRIDPFVRAESDDSDRLVISDKLYGRGAQMAALDAAFERVAGRATPELVLVSGYSGAGKSAIVHELQAAIAPRGLFAAGKFDQYKRDIPYATLEPAFRSLMRQLLGKSDEQLALWRESLRDALGRNGQLMVALIPELADIIGEQPSVPDLPPEEARNRFHLVFQRFLGVFARPEHPLALFFDDLQWLDAATLELLERLVTQPEPLSLLVIGAYRENEVTDSHPLMRTLGVLRSGAMRVQEVVLTPLQLDDVAALLIDALHTCRARVQALAELVCDKTGGNPFFVIQFVRALAEQGLLTFDAHVSAWQWDVSRIDAQHMTDNVADLMAAKLGRLSDDSRELLGQLACLGSVAEAATVRLISEKSEGEIEQALSDAVRARLLRREESSYSFLHDRIQEAAYALIPAERRAAVHLRIGRLLASRSAPRELEEGIFEIVNQLGRGTHLVESLEERERFVLLYLMAGRRAQTSMAHGSALGYFSQGRALQHSDSWDSQYRVTFDLELHRSECEFLSGELPIAEERLAALSARATNLSDRAAVTRLRLRVYQTLDRIDRAVEVGLAYLRHIGIDWPSAPDDAAVNEELAGMWQRLDGRPIEELLDLPVMTDHDWRATMEVMAELMPPAGFYAPNLLDLILLRMVNLSLEYGNCDASCFSYSSITMVLGFRFDDYKASLRFGQLSYDLVEKRGFDRLRARTFMHFGAMVTPWVRHLPTGRAVLQRGFDAAVETGDVPVAICCGSHLITNLIGSGEPLVDVQREIEVKLTVLKNRTFGLAVNLFTAPLTLVRALRGIAPSPSSFDGAEVDERQFEEQLERDPWGGTAVCRYWIRKLQARYFTGDYAVAFQAASKAEKLIWSWPSFFEEAEYRFFRALVCAALCDVSSAEERTKYREEVAAQHEKLVLWAQNCPENFADRAALVRAELARLDGRELAAERDYEDAIRLAAEHGFIQNEALGNELAGCFYKGRGFVRIADLYLATARRCYLRWGADGKVRQLDQAHPQLRDQWTPSTPTATVRAPLEQLDIGSMIKASQVLSSEIVLDRLIETLMRIVVEHAAAEHGLLILLRNEPQIAARATTRFGKVEVALHDADVSPLDLPASALHYVIRTQKSLILDDASSGGLLSDDAYIREHRPRSVLCIPIMKQAKVIAALYLENNLSPGAFTPEQIAVLEFLATQAAISLENAYVYADLKRSETFLAEGQRMSGTGSWSWSISTGDVVWSEELYRIFGFDSRKERRPNIDLFLQAVHPEDRATVRRELDAAIAAGSAFAQDFRVLLSDGSVKHLHGAGRPLIDESGEMREFVGTTIDMSERKRGEDALRNAQADLLRVARLTTMGELTASIAHEMNQPLAAIVANAESSLLWLAKTPPNLEKAQQASERIVRDGHYAGQVIRGIRAMVHKSSLEMVRLDMHGLIQGIVALMRAELRRHDVRLELELAGGVGVIMGEPVQLQQVIVNLMMNAVEAMSATIDGPRVLRVATELDDDGALTVAVTDSGPGLDPSLTGRIFEPWFTTKPDGMGMGLSICRSIVQAHGGLLWASPAPQRGSVFHLKLPAMSNEP